MEAYGASFFSMETRRKLGALSHPTINLFHFCQLLADHGHAMRINLLTVAGESEVVEIATGRIWELTGEPWPTLKARKKSAPATAAMVFL